MDPSTVARILEDLNERPARVLETQTLEFKGWCKDEKELSSEICEAAVCLANAEGGLIIVGVDDKKTGAAAISQCPYPSLTVDWIRMRIRDLTKPPVQCHVTRLGDLLQNLRAAPSGNLFIVEVSKTTLPSGHRTQRGISLIRADTECRTDYLVEKDDYTEICLESLTYTELYETAITAAIKNREARFPEIKRLGHRSIDHLSETGLVRLKEDAFAPRHESFILSLAAFLLLGREEKIKAEVPAAESVFAVETSITAPLTSSNWHNIVEALRIYVPLINSQLAAREVRLPESIISELLLNAYLHRCYRTCGPVQIRIRENEIEIQNPGGLLGGLTAETLIYDPPIYRNFKLADAARQFGYCEKAGTGIDKVYYLTIADGLEFPVFHSAGNSFSVIIRTKRDEAFAKFIKDNAGTLNLSLPDLIVIRVLRSRVEADTPYLTKFAQRPVDYMEGALRDLQRRNIIHKSKSDRYKLTETILNQMARYDDKGHLSLL